MDTFTEPELGSTIEVRAQIEGADPHRVPVRWLYDELMPDGQVHRHVWDQVYHRREEHRLRQLIQLSPLKIQAIYGDYLRGPYVPRSDRLLLILENQ